MSETNPSDIKCLSWPLPTLIKDGTTSEIQVWSLVMVSVEIRRNDLGRFDNIKVLKKKKCLN